MSTTWKSIRIFISSTFQDIHAARDHLVRFVFPELKEKCRVRLVHLVDVDPRWGVSEPSQREHRTMELFLEEIARCQRLSLRTNFIVLSLP